MPSKNKNILVKLIAILNIPLVAFFTALIVFSFFFYSPSVDVSGDIRGILPEEFNSVQTIRLRFFEDSYEGELIGSADYSNIEVSEGRFGFQIPLEVVPEDSFVEACVIINETEDDANCSEQNIFNPTSCQREYVGDLSLLDYFQNIDLTSFNLSCASAINPDNFVPGNWFDDTKLSTNDDYAKLSAAIQDDRVSQQIVNNVTNIQSGNVPNLIFQGGILSIEGGNSVNLNGLGGSTNVTNETIINETTIVGGGGAPNLSLDGNVLVVDGGNNVDLSNLFLSVDTTNIVDSSILNEDLADNIIDTNKLIDGSVTEDKIADGAVTTEKIADCSANGLILKFYQVDPDGVGPLQAGWNCDIDNGIGTELDGVIGNEVLDATASRGLERSGAGTDLDPYTLGVADDGISNVMIADGAVDSDKILDGSVANVDLANDSVSTNNIIDGTITNSDLANNSVNTSNIIDGTITNDDLDINSVDGSNIIDGSITNADITPNSITGGSIQDGSITILDLGSNSVDSSKILDGSITNNDLATNSVDGSNIIDGSVGTADLANCSVQGHILKYYATDPDGAGPLTVGWNCDSESGITSEVDGVIGNEVFDLFVDASLTQTGTKAGGYTVGVDVDTAGNTSTISSNSGLEIASDGLRLIGGCSTDEILKYNATTSTWNCSADANTEYTGSTGVMLVGNDFQIDSPTCLGSTKLQWTGSGFICSIDVDTTDFDISVNSGAGENISSGETVNFDNGTGTVASRTGNSIVYSLTNTGVTPGTYNNVTTDAQGRITSATNVAYLTTETDGVIGNEVFDITTDASIIRTGTKAAGYNLSATLGTSIDSSEIVDGTIQNSDLATGSVNSSSILDGSISILDIGTGAVGSTQILNGSITNADLAGNSVNSSNIIDGSINGSDIANGAITFDKFASCSGDNVLLYYYTTDPDGAGPITTGWNCIIDPALTSEVDGVIGNELLNATIGGGLERAGAGNTSDPFTIGLRTDCSNGQKLEFDGSGWVCSNSSVVTGYNALTGDLEISNLPDVSLISTFEITDGSNSRDIDVPTGSILFSGTQGIEANVSGSGDEVTYSLAACSGNEILKYFASDPDGAGPLVAGWNCAADDGLTTENDGIIGNEVLNATTSGGLVRAGAGTAGDPYTLGIDNGGVVLAMLAGDSVDSSKIVDGSIDNDDLGADSVTSSEILDGTVANADLATNSVNSSNIIDDTVTSADILDETITGDDILNGSIALIDLGSNSVNSSKIVDGSISTADIGNDQITFAKLADCTAANEILKYNGSIWTCVDDANITYTAGDGIDLTGSVFSVDSPTCTSQEKLIWTGTSFSCENTLEYYAESTVAPLTGPLVAGSRSISIGDGAETNGDNSFTIGNNSIVDGGSSYSIGDENLIYSDTSYALGYFNEIDGANSYIIGEGGFINGDNNYIFGVNNFIDSVTGYTVIGNGNFLNQTTGIGAIIGNNNSTGITADAYTFGANIFNSLPNSVQLGTSDATKVVIESDGDIQFYGALMPNNLPGSSGQVLVSQGASTEPIWDDVSNIYTETDGVVGNEILNVGSTTGLLRGGSGTSGDPYTVDIKACANGEVLKYNTGSSTWDCSADSGVGSETDGVIGNEILNVGATTGLVRAGIGSAGDPYTVDIKSCANNEILKYNTTTSAWDCSTDNGVGTESDGVIGNEVLNATTSGGLIRAGAGTAGDPYTLGIDTDGVTNAMLDDDAVDTTNILDGTILLADLASNSVDTNKIVDGTISNADYGFGSITSNKIQDLTIDSLDIANQAITGEKLANCTASNQILVYYTTDPDGAGPLEAGWNCDTNSAITSEVDGVIGNEITNVGTTSALVRSGAGTTGDPYIVDLKACGADEILKYNNTASTWDCVVDNDTQYTDGDGLSLSSGTFSIDSPTCLGTTKLQWNGTAFICSPDVDTTDFDISANGGTGQNISDGSTINFVDGTGTTASRAGTDISFGLTATGVAPGTYNNVTTNAQGRITAASNVAYLTAETDGVIGNEVLNATTSGGLVRAGAGTSGDPYTLGIANGGVTLARLASNSVDSTKIVDGAVALADLGSNSVNSAKIVDGSVATSDLANCANNDRILKYYTADPDGAGPLVAGWNCTVDDGITSEADGVIGNEVFELTTGNSIVRTGSKAAGYNIEVDTSTTGTTATASSNSGLELGTDGIRLIGGCNDGEHLTWNGTSEEWECDTDANTTYSAGNGLNLSVGTFSINSPTCSGTDKLQWTGSAFVCSTDIDTTDLNISANGGATSNLTAGDTIDFDDGTGTTASRTGNNISFSLTNTGVTPGTYNNVTTDAQGRITAGSNVAYLTTETDGVIGNEVFDVTTDSSITRTGTKAAGYNLAAVLGTTIDSAEIVNGTVALVDLANNSVDSSRIVDSSVGLNDLAGNSVNSSKIVDGSITTVDIADLAITRAKMANCASQGQILKYYTTDPDGAGPLTTGWNCDADATGLASEVDGVIGNEVFDLTVGNGLTRTGSKAAGYNVDLDATTTGTTTTTSANSGLEVTTAGLRLVGGCTTNQILKWNGSAWACAADVDTDTDTGVTALGTPTGSNANGGSITGSTLTLSFADTTNPGLVSTGTQTFGGNKTFNNNLTVNGNSNLGNGAGDLTTITGQIEGAGLVDCDNSGDKLTYDATSNLFGCGSESLNGKIVRKTVDETLSSSTTLQNDDHLFFNVGANETWSFIFNVTADAQSSADFQFAVTAPSGSTCQAHTTNLSSGQEAETFTCGASMAVNSTTSNDKPYFIAGTITTGGTAGTIRLQWAQNSSNGNPNTVRRGSYVQAFEETGADLAEIFYSDDYSVEEAEIVSIVDEGVSQIEKASNDNRNKAIGIVSTKPGIVLNEADGRGKPLPLALTGRVPVKVTTQNNGPIRAGDMITTSDIAGVGQRATTSGRVIGKALENFDGETGTVMVFVEAGYWQAPIQIDLSSIFGNTEAIDIVGGVSDELTAEVADLGLDNVIEEAKSYDSFGQEAVDEILSGFKLQQEQIDELRADFDEFTKQSTGVASQEEAETALDIPEVGIELYTGGEIVDSADLLNSIQPVQYTDEEGSKKFGFSTLGLLGNENSVDFEQITSILVKTVQDQQKQIDQILEGNETDLESSTGLDVDLESFKESFLIKLDEINLKNEEQDNRINELQAKIEELTKSLEEVKIEQAQ